MQWLRKNRLKHQLQTMYTSDNMGLSGRIQLIIGHDPFYPLPFWSLLKLFSSIRSCELTVRHGEGNPTVWTVSLTAHCDYNNYIYGVKCPQMFFL